MKEYDLVIPPVASEATNDQQTDWVKEYVNWTDLSLGQQQRPSESLILKSVREAR